MQLQTDVAEPGLDQPVMHHRQRRHLFRYKQRGLGVMRSGGDQVGDGLRFSGAGRPLHYKTGAAPHLFDHLSLGGVGIDHLNDVSRVKQGIQSVLGANDRWLGKTLVARGVIARTIEALWHDVPRIDIIYVCSNGAIARQNLRKLNVMEGEAQSLPTRLTLLPLHLGMAGGLRGQKVNFVSLTPNTAFKLTDGSGSMEERALLLRLMDHLNLPKSGAINLFQAHAGTKGWRSAREAMATRSIDAGLADAFRTRLDQSPDLIMRLRHLCARFADSPNSPDEPARRGRESVIGELRSLLAAECVSALEPDLIILDEFHRFDDLLHGETEASVLAQALFDYRSGGHAARTLLLSVTPYRMMTLSGDSGSEGDHYREFLDVVAFLFGSESGKASAADLAQEMQRFRQAMQALPGSFDIA